MAPHWHRFASANLLQKLPLTTLHPHIRLRINQTAQLSVNWPAFCIRFEDLKLSSHRRIKKTHHFYCFDEIATHKFIYMITLITKYCNLRRCTKVHRNNNSDGFSCSVVKRRNRKIILLLPQNRHI